MWKLFSFTDKKITRVQQKANSLLENRYGHALANYKNEFIMASGGMQTTGEFVTIASAEVYSVAENRWSLVPDMNVSRSWHGSCAVANYVYTACGKNYNKKFRGKFLKSIERIDMNAIDNGWEELLVSSCKQLSRRKNILMAGLSCDELVILGGRGTGEEGLKGDGYILDIPEMRLNTVIRDTKDSIKFAVVTNLSIKMSDSKVAFLTMNN